MTESSSTLFFVVLRRTSHILDACIHIRNLKQPVQFTKKLVQGDPWTLAHQEQMNREEIWQMANARATRSHCEADFRGMFWSTVVGIAGVASLISGWTDKYPMWTPSGRSSYATCQTWPPRLAKWHREIGKTSQMTHRIAEGMHTGLVQWVQWTKDSQTEAKSLRALHGEPWEIRIPPEYQAASTLENNFLFWPRRFMTLEIHLLQMRKCCEAAGVELWAKIGPLAISSLNSDTSAICKS